MLKREINGKRIIYLDNAATTFKPDQVIDAVNDYYKNKCANINRGNHILSDEATEIYENARKTIAGLINANKDEIIFTSNATHAINMISSSGFCRDGNVISSVLEHHSNMLPWINNTEARFAGMDDKGLLKLDDYETLIDDETRLITINHLSNVTGIINPIDKIINIAHKRKIPVLIDATQSVPHINIDVKELGCDFMAFSGHKMLGPTGIGVLYARKEVIDKIDPVFTGGGMVKDVSLENVSLNKASDLQDKINANVRYKDGTEKLEPGTPNIAGAVGLAAAADYLKNIGLSAIERHEKNLLRLALDLIKDMNGIKDYNLSEVGTNNRINIIPFNIKNIRAGDTALMLNNRSNIMVRGGYLCAQPLCERLFCGKVIRASSYIYNTEDDIRIFADTIKKIRNGFV